MTTANNDQPSDDAANKRKAEAAKKRDFKRLVRQAAEESGLGLPSVVRRAELRADLAKAARTMGAHEARFLVDYYYMQQGDRKRAHNQVRALLPGNEPHNTVAWLALNAEMVENIIRDVLGLYANTQVPGRWADSIVGIGPVISAGLLAHIDITKCRTVSQLWRFAGLDPTQTWLGTEGAKVLVKEVREVFPGRELPSDAMVMLGKRSSRNPENLRRLASDVAGEVTWTSVEKALAKRPWNEELHTLVSYKLGESFVKVSNNDKDVYGHLYAERKLQEEARNQAGQYSEQAGSKLERFNIGRDTDAFKAYSAGRLPPAHIHRRSTRGAVKVFLSHYHAVAYEDHYKVPAPRPYVFDHLGHQHQMAIPNWPMPKEVEAAKTL